MPSRSIPDPNLLVELVILQYYCCPNSTLECMAWVTHELSAACPLQVLGGYQLQSTAVRPAYIDLITSCMCHESDWCSIQRVSQERVCEDGA